MYSKYPFPISMENLPRQHGFCCLSLKFGAIFTALIVILYSILGLAQCGAALGVFPKEVEPEFQERVQVSVVILTTVVNSVNFFLSAIMLLGVLKESPQLIRPWLIWSSAHLLVASLLFVFFTAASTITHAADISVLYYVVELVCLMIRIYMLIIVSSYYRQLEEDLDSSERLRKLIDREMWYSVA